MGRPTQNLENSINSQDSHVNSFLRLIYDGRMELELFYLNWPSNDHLVEAMYCLVQAVRNIPRDIIAAEMVQLRHEVYGTPLGLDHSAVDRFCNAVRKEYAAYETPIDPKTQSRKSRKSNKSGISQEKHKKLKKFSPEWVFLFYKAVGRLGPGTTYAFQVTKAFLSQDNKKRGPKSTKNLPENYQRISLEIISQTRKSLRQMFEEYIDELNWNLETLKLDPNLLTHIAIYGMDFMSWMGVHIHYLLQSSKLTLDEVDETLRAMLASARGAALRDLRKYNGYEEVAKSEFPLRPMAIPGESTVYNYNSLKLIDEHLSARFSEPATIDSKVEKRDSHGPTKRMQKTTRKRPKKRRSKQKV
jgi:hypothetical protein